MSIKSEYTKAIGLIYYQSIGKGGYNRHGVDNIQSLTREFIQKSKAKFYPKYAAKTSAELNIRIHQLARVKFNSSFEFENLKSDLKKSCKSSTALQNSVKKLVSFEIRNINFRAEIAVVLELYEKAKNIDT